MFKLIYKLLGWKAENKLPKDVKQYVLIVAPHTSNWDFVLGVGAWQTLGIKAKFAIKKEWLKFPLKKLMLSLGALPIDRSPATKLGEKKGAVDAMVDLFKNYNDLKLIITPEGTRSKVIKWKTGFYYVALKANVPIALGILNYEKKKADIEKLVYPSGDFKKDMKQIMDFYKSAKPKNPQNFSIDIELGT